MELILLTTYYSIGAATLRYLPCTQPNTSQWKLARLARLASLGLPKLKLSSLGAPNVPRYGMSLIANQERHLGTPLFRYIDCGLARPPKNNQARLGSELATQLLAKCLALAT